MAASSRFTGFPAILKDSENWVRVALSTQHLLKPALLKVLHNDDNDPSYSGLPRDKKQLFIAVSNLKLKYTKEFDKCLKGNQLAIVLPSDGSNESDSLCWDITIIHFFISKGTTLPPPYGGYKHPSLPPSKTCPKTGAVLQYDVRSFYCLDAKQLRNEIFHSCDFNISDNKLQVLFQRIKNILKALNYHSLILNDLESGSLDRFFQSSVNVLKAKLQYLSGEVSNVQLKQSVQTGMIEKLFQKHEDQKTQFLSSREGTEIKTLVYKVMKKEVLYKVFKEFEIMKCSHHKMMVKLHALMKELKTMSSQNTRSQFIDCSRMIAETENEIKAFYASKDLQGFQGKNI